MWSPDGERGGLIKYIEPVSRRSATGVTARVYQGMRREFGVHAEPIVLHSPVPELLAGAWSLCREHLVAGGEVDRAVKEALATAVSSINRCPFCIDAHAVMLAATGHLGAAGRLERGEYDGLRDPALADVVRWAVSTRSPDAEVLRSPPFEEREAPELIGTAVLFHYINRPVTVFLGESPLPGNGRVAKRGLLWVGGHRFKQLARARPRPGESLELLAGAELPDDLSWTDGSAVLAEAWARFAAAVERAGEASLPAEVRARVQARLRRWSGEDPGLRQDWLDEGLEGLEEGQRPAGRLALLAALAPYRVDDQVISSVRATLTRDGAAPDGPIVGAVSWAAFAAARRIGSWISRPGVDKEPSPSSYG